MRQDLVKAYIPSCMECQQNKSSIKKLVGLLHSFLILECCFRLVTLDFVGLLSVNNGFDEFCFMTCYVDAEIQISPCKITWTSEDFMEIFLETSIAKTASYIK